MKYGRMKIEGETTKCSAEGASQRGESLRQKYFYWTHLWRVLYEPPKEQLFLGNSQAQRTE